MAASRNRTPPEARLSEAVAGVLAAAGVAPGQTVCVALSGGVDSVVLLEMLAGLREGMGFSLVAAHVHHGLSPNADGWLDFCARLCAVRDVAFQPFRAEVDRHHSAGLEAAAREVRHAALARVPCDWLAFGHHQDDQAETLVLRLLRGTGLHGAGAMASVEPGAPGRLRPLLGVRRADIVACARTAGLQWVEDESNADPHFTRNLLRHRIVPVIEHAFPAAVPALARASAHFREADALLDELAALDQERCGGLPMLRAEVLSLSDERMRNLLRWQIRSMGLEVPSRARLFEAVRQLRAVSEAALQLPLGKAVCCAYRHQVWLEADAAGEIGEPVCWNGEDELRWGGGAVRFESLEGGGLSRAALERAGEVVLCVRWPGLALRQGPERPRRSLKNLCQEAGVPAWLRPRLPVLRVDGEAAWIAEIGAADGFRCAPGEEGVLPVWRR